MEINFNGKTALVTGAGKGIGRGIAIALNQCGADTFALSRTQSDLDSLKSVYPSMQTLCVELADWDATRKAVQDIGPIDLLVNNAAVARPAPFLDSTPEDFDCMMNVNAKAVLNVSQVVGKGMVERGKGGSIVNVSSQASQLAMADIGLYSATKGALDAMTRIMALELGPHQIRVNSVHPTIVMTDMGIQLWSDEAKAKPQRDKIPMGKFAEVKDVVHPVLYLLSDQADMINGAFLPIDGGVWAT